MNSYYKLSNSVTLKRDVYENKRKFKNVRLCIKQIWVYF